MKKQSIIYELKDQEFFDFLTAMIDEKVDFEKDDVIQSLLVMSLNEINYDIADKLCTKFIHDKDFDISALSVMAISHIARVYGKLVNKELYDYICEIYKDKKHPLCGHVDEALSGIQVSLKIPKPDDIGGVRMKKEEEEGGGFTLWKSTALNLSKEISALFEDNVTVIILPEQKLQIESDKLRVTIIFEEIKE